MCESILLAVKYPLGVIYHHFHNKYCRVDSVEWCRQKPDAGGLKSKWEVEKKDRCGEQGGDLFGQHVWLQSVWWTVLD